MAGTQTRPDDLLERGGVIRLDPVPSPNRRRTLVLLAVGLMVLSAGASLAFIGQGDPAVRVFGWVLVSAGGSCGFAALLRARND